MCKLVGGGGRPRDHLGRTRGERVDLPVAFAAAFLLRFGGIGAGEASLAEIAREVLFGDCGAISETDVVTVVALVCTSHC